MINLIRNSDCFYEDLQANLDESNIKFRNYTNLYQLEEEVEFIVYCRF